MTTCSIRCALQDKHLHCLLQEVIDNLTISAMQYRAESDPDIRPHVHERCVQQIVVPATRELEYCKSTLRIVLVGVMESLRKVGVS